MKSIKKLNSKKIIKEVTDSLSREMLDEINREVIHFVMNKRRNKIMKKYKDDKENKFFNFIITVPRQEDKDELLEAFRYLHDLKELDTDFIIVNQLVHLYMDESENPVKIVVDRGAFAYLNKEHKNEKKTQKSPHEN